MTRVRFYPHSCQSLLPLVFFDDSHSNSCEVITHCALDLHFLDDSWYWEPFHESVGHLEKSIYIGILDDFEGDIIWNPHWKQCYRFAQGVNWFAFDFLSEVLTLENWHGIRGRIQRFNCPPLSYFSNNCWGRKAYYYYFFLKDDIKILGFFSVSPSLFFSSAHSVTGINLRMSEDTLVTLTLSFNYQHLPFYLETVF